MASSVCAHFVAGAESLVLGDGEGQLRGALYEVEVEMITGATTAVILWLAQAGGDLPASAALHWQEDYGTAMKLARRDKQMMLVEFHADGTTRDQDRLVQILHQDERLRKLAQRYTLVRVPVSRTGSVGGQEVQLIKHGAFAELQQKPGIAIIDLHDPDGPHYGRVVSVYPLGMGWSYETHYLAVLLDLPTGSLTQRTLIFAVRTYPERAASADGEFSNDLAQESESHSSYQAAIALQGHHNWESRFHRINARLPGGLLSQEVCAESWPGQGLVEAAIECVRSWRQSSGHWSAVRSRHRYFGYDMKRGPNGVWYATGIFAIGR